MAEKAAKSGAIAGAALGAEIGSAYPIIGNALGAVIGALIGFTAGILGGVKQDRFVDRTKEVFKIFRDAGYVGHPDQRSYTKYKLGASQVKNKKDDGYTKEFARLAQYIHDRLELYSPGLGDYWAQVYPMQMLNLGQIKDGSISGLRTLVNENKMNLSGILDTLGKVAETGTKVVDTYQSVKTATTGKVSTSNLLPYETSLGSDTAATRYIFGIPIVYVVLGGIALLLLFGKKLLRVFK